MSQAKVDKYKEQKANRKEIMAKEKRQKNLMKFGAGVVCGLLAVWIGVSSVIAIIDARPRKTIFATTDGIAEYLEDLYEEETESTTEKDTAKEDK